MISILIPHKFRTHVPIEDGSILSLFPRCIDSLKESIVDIDAEFELVVADFGSEEPMTNWLTEERAGMPVTIVHGENPFNRGKAINLAAKHTKGDVYCLMDTDMILCRDFWTFGMAALIQNMSFFPICWEYSNQEETEGFWQVYGYGMSIVKKEWFDKVGGVQEKQVWGGEDNVFVNRISKLVKVSRPNIANYFHQWHPKEMSWKNRFIK